jgi:hypothetical protein
MNKNGVIAVVVVVAAIILLGLWAMRSGDQRAGGLDCSAPPATPTGVSHTKAGDVVTITWSKPPVTEVVTSYIIDAKAARDPQPTIFVAPGTATSFQRQAPPGTYAVHVSARNACGSSPPSSELVIAVP